MDRATMRYVHSFTPSDAISKLAICMTAMPNMVSISLAHLHLLGVYAGYVGVAGANESSERPQAEVTVPMSHAGAVRVQGQVLNMLEFMDRTR